MSKYTYANEDQKTWQKLSEKEKFDVQDCTEVGRVSHHGNIEWLLPSTWGYDRGTVYVGRSKAEEPLNYSDLMGMFAFDLNSCTPVKLD
jgi:hypothetical protein